MFWRVNMFTEQEEYHIQEIQELTDYIRTDEDWEELRTILIEKGFNLQELLLTSFMEDEELNEYGAIVTINDKKIYEYERHVGGGVEQFNLTEITNNIDRQGDFPQILTALKMIDKGDFKVL
jgi:hypothetical protein